MKKIPMILLAMFTLSGCDRQEMIYSFNHVEEASVDNEVENTESVDNIQAETEQAVDITTEETEISDVYSGPTVTLAMVGDVLLHTPVEESCLVKTLEKLMELRLYTRKLSGRGWLL